LKKICAILITTVILLTFAVSPVYAVIGNRAPSGAHYNLNIIGAKYDKNANFSGGDGHRIFVDLNGSTKIMLAEGDFAVQDANGTDGTAKFQLPNPGPANSVTSQYSVYARALGKPGGKADMTTGAYQWIDLDADGVVDDGELFLRMSVITLSLNRTNGKQVFDNVTKYLLYMYADLNGDGVAERYNLFNDALQDYFWQYDNQGLKLAQLRFYPGVQAAVPDAIPLPWLYKKIGR
jgi:hypothetical protein